MSYTRCRVMLIVFALALMTFMVLPPGNATYAQQESPAVAIGSEQAECPRVGIRRSLTVSEQNATAYLRNVLNRECTVSLAVYKMFIPFPESGWLVTQELYDSDIVVLPPGGSAVLRVENPPCMAQVDLAVGEPVTDFAVDPWIGRLLAGRFVELPLCEDELDISVAKTNDANEDGEFTDAEQAQPGATVQFQIVITNNEDQEITLVDINDDTHELSGSPCETLVGETLAAHSSVTCTFTGTIPDQHNLNEVNTVSVVAVDAAGHQGTATDVSTVTTPDVGGAGGPAVQVTKTLVTAGAAADGIVKVGQIVTFTITIQNIGDTNLVTVPLKDLYNPFHLAYVDASPKPNDSSTPGILVWHDLLADGEMLAPQAFITPEVMVSFQAVGSTQNLAPDEQTTNEAVVANAIDENSETADQDEDRAPVHITNPAVSIFKQVTAPATGVVATNEEVTFTIRIANIGDTQLVKIPTYDRYDPGELLYLRTSLTTMPAVDEDTGELAWADVTEDPQVGDLAPGESTSFSVTFRYIGAPGASTTNVAFLDEGEVFDEFGDTANPVQGQASASVNGEPTAIALLRFSAVRQNTGVQVTWITGAEINSWGFHLWRSASTDWRQATRITQPIHLAQGSASHGARYSYLDLDASATQAVFYWLQELEMNGTANLYGPIGLSMSPSGDPGTVGEKDLLFLPQIQD